MPITPQQREDRRAHLGGSDLPALVLGPAHRLYEVWASKVFPTDDVTNAAMEYGNLFEGPVLTLAEKQLGPIRRNCTVALAGTPIATNVDGIVDETGEPVEAKTSGLKGPVYGEWGDDGTDQVPDAVMVQCHGHMLATGAEVCHVPALIGGRGFLMFHVERCNDLCDIITTRAAKFWSEHVETATPPDAAWDALSGPSLDILKRIKRVPGKLAKPRMDLVKRYETAKAWYSMAEKMRDATKAELIGSLGDTEGALLPDGRMIKYMAEKRKGHTVAPSAPRVLRIGKISAGLRNKLEAQIDRELLEAKGND